MSLAPRVRVDRTGEADKNVDKNIRAPIAVGPPSEKYQMRTWTVAPPVEAGDWSDSGWVSSTGFSGHLSAPIFLPHVFIWRNNIGKQKTKSSCKKKCQPRTALKSSPKFLRGSKRRLYSSKYR